MIRQQQESRPPTNTCSFAQQAPQSKLLPTRQCSQTGCRQILVRGAPERCPALVNAANPFAERHVHLACFSSLATARLVGRASLDPGKATAGDLHNEPPWGQRAKF